MADFYNGDRLLNTLDLNGNKPEIFICVGNRSSGKSFYFKRFVASSVREVILLVRYKYEVKGYAKAYFEDLPEYRDKEIKTFSQAGGVFESFTVDGKRKGFVIPLSGSDTIKRSTSLFNKVDAIIFDEFQSENDHYLPVEIEKFISIHASAARAYGEQVRYLPCFLISNAVRTINPYFSALGIAERLQSNTKFLRGNGWVLEISKNQSAFNAHKASLFSSAFGKQQMTAYLTGETVLLDNVEFISKRPSDCACYPFARLYYSSDEYISMYTISGGEIIFYFDDKEIKGGSSLPNFSIAELGRKKGRWDMRLIVDLARDLRRAYDLGKIAFSSQKVKELVISSLAF